MSNTIQCPHCGATVNASEGFCGECFSDVRVANAPIHTEPVGSPITRDNRSDETESSKPPAQPENRSVQNPAVSPAPKATPPEPAIKAEPPPPGANGDNRGNDANDSDESPVNSSDATAEQYRPRLRPPMAVLCIFDDDFDDNEKIRLRSGETTIGRRECDIVIPHDRMMSSKHAKIIRKYDDGMYRWFLKDLQSTNRTMLKVRAGKLKHNAEILIGTYRYRFSAAPQGAPTPEEVATDDEPMHTMGFKSVAPEDLLKQKPSLIRITPEGEKDVFAFDSNDVVVGSSAPSSVVISDDPMISKAHVRIYQDAHRRWQLKDLNSRNGIWIAIDTFELDKNAQFQLGEQRFCIRFP